jgi:hypothetical protein
MPISTQIYFDILEAAFFPSHKRGSAWQKAFLKTETEYAINCGFIEFDGHSYTSLFLLNDLIEFAMFRVQQIKDEQKRLFGEVDPIVETEHLK